MSSMSSQRRATCPVINVESSERASGGPTVVGKKDGDGYGGKTLILHFIAKTLIKLSVYT